MRRLGCFRIEHNCFLNVVLARDPNAVFANLIIWLFLCYVKFYDCLSLKYYIKFGDEQYFWGLLVTLLFSSTSPWVGSVGEKKKKSLLICSLSLLKVIPKTERFENLAFGTSVSIDTNSLQVRFTSQSMHSK